MDSTKKGNPLGLLTISLYEQNCTHFLDQIIFSKAMLGALIEM